MKLVDGSVSRFKGLSPKFKLGAHEVAGVILLLLVMSFVGCGDEEGELGAAHSGDDILANNESTSSPADATNTQEQLSDEEAATASSANKVAPQTHSGKEDSEYLIKPEWDKRFFSMEETLRVAERPTLGSLRMGMHLDDLPDYFNVLQPRPNDMRFEPEVSLAASQGALPKGVFPDYVHSVVAFFAGKILYKVVYKISIAYSTLSPNILRKLNIQNNRTKKACLEIERIVKSDFRSHYLRSDALFTDLISFEFHPGRRLSAAEIDAIELAMILKGAVEAGTRIAQVDGGIKAPTVYVNDRGSNDVYCEMFREQGLFVAVKGQEWETIGNPDSSDGSVYRKWIIADHVWMPFVERYGDMYSVIKSSQLQKKWGNLPQ
jgi:hypothetical protein